MELNGERCAPRTSMSTAMASYSCCVTNLQLPSLDKKQGDCSSPFLVLNSPMTPKHLSMFARAVLVPHTPLLIPPYPMMRTRCWSLFLELMTKLPVWPWESPILTITNCLFSAFQLSSSKIYKPKH